MERYYKKMRIFLYGKVMSSACYASNSIVQFNHKGFVICSNDLATYVLQTQIKKIELYSLITRYVYGYPFFALFFAISVDLCWGGIGKFLLRIENIFLRKTYVFRLLRFKFHCSVQPQGIYNLQQ